MGSTTPADFTTSIIESESAFQALAPEWDSLVERCRFASVFSTWDWVYAWWCAYATPADRPLIIAVRQQDRLVGLAPLYSRSVRTPFGGAFQRIGFIGDSSKDSEYLDLICDDACRDVVLHKMVGHLFFGEISWHILELLLMREDSPSILAIRETLDKTVDAHFTWTDTPSRPVMLPSGWPAYLDMLKRRKRQTVQAHLRRIHEDSLIRVERCRDAEALPFVLSSLFQMHQKRWAASNRFGAFSNKERRRFYSDMAARFLENDQLRLYTLLIDEVPAAHEFSFVYRKTLYALQQAYDPRFKKESVSNMLRAAVLYECIEAGLEVYDFLGGDEAYKQRWGAVPFNTINVSVARPGLIGRACIDLPRSVSVMKTRLKAKTPPALLEMKHRTVDRLHKTWFHLVHRLKPGGF